MTEPLATALESLPYDVVLRAKHIVSHLLLQDGASVLVPECETGVLVAAMAQLNPRLQFIGMDRNRQMIMRARARFKTVPNVMFEVSDILGLRKPDESVDAVVANNLMGEIYSRSNYDEARIEDALARAFKVLKTDGTMVIYDYAMPSENEFVQIEFPVPMRDNRAFRIYGTPLAQTQGEREIELLQWFAQHARARDTVKGFYLEELAPIVPYTRLFRLPAKWAYEYIIRKTNVRKFKNHIGHQYTALTDRDFDRLLGRSLGMRVLYTAPWRNAHIIRTHFEGSFRLYTAEGKARGYMPSAHIVVAQKVAQGRAMRIGELRPSVDAPASLSIQAVRDDRTGETVDIVGRDMPVADVIPYFVTSDGRIKIILRSQADKGIANVIPRARHNLDGKRWSGYMPSAVTFTAAELEGFDHASHAAVARLIVQKLGLRTVHSAMFENGPKGYPAPSMIDELLETLFINVQRPDNGLRVAGPQDALGLKIYDVEDVLRATGAGFIPNAWLDIQMQELMKKLGHKVTPWLHEAVPLSYEPPPSDQMLIAKKVLKQKPDKGDKGPRAAYVMGGKGTKWANASGAFRPIRGKAGQVNTYRSAFVEQGRIDGGIRGLSAHDQDFACPKDELMNIAAIMPLTEDLQGNTLAGFEFKELPVPSRFGQTDAMMNLPTLPLPNEITDIDSARAYIAAQFDVEVSRVAPMGESFFTYVDMMPQRVFPFMLTRYPRRRNLRIRYMMTKDLLDLIDPDFADSILWKWGFANAMLCQSSAQVQGYGAKARHNYGASTSSKWHSASASNTSAPATPPKKPEHRHRHT